MSDRIPGSSPSNPVVYRGWNIHLGAPEQGHQFAYEYAHDDYDGADDAFDTRCGYAASISAAKAHIDAYEAEAAGDDGDDIQDLIDRDKES